MTTPLTDAERRRYARHLTLPEIGEQGQIALRDSSVIVVGAGGLGSPCLLYLAAAGVGRLGLIDFDAVDASNLQRQILYGTSQIGSPKARAAATRLGDLNPSIAVEAHSARLTADNALDLLVDYDLVVDGSDRFATRYLVNDACEILGKPLVYAAIQGFAGQLAVFNHEGGPTLRDLFPEPPPPELAPRCAEAGVLGVLPGILGVLQASEAIKLLLGIGEPLGGRLLLVDALGPSFRVLRLERDPARQPPRDLSAHAVAWSVLDPAEVRARVQAGWAPSWIDVRTPEEHRAERIPETVLRRSPDEIQPTDLPLGDVLLYCASGVRSAVAARSLIAAGVEPTRIHELRGGLRRWRGQG